MASKTFVNGLDGCLTELTWFFIILTGFIDVDVTFTEFFFKLSLFFLFHGF